MSDSDKEYLTVEDICKMKGVSKSFVIRYARALGNYGGGKGRRFLPEKVEWFFEARANERQEKYYGVGIPKITNVVGLPDPVKEFEKIRERHGYVDLRRKAKR
jgi:hypothetical protein